MKTIDDIILQYSNRGMKELYSKHQETKNAPIKSAKKLKEIKRGNIFIYTGFYVKGSAETDGPLGAYFLSISLKKIGFSPIIITDKYCKDFFKDIRTIYIPIKKHPISYYENILNLYDPVAHISIERCAKNIKNRYLNCNNEDISQYTANIDELFILGDKKSLSIAIGDGGNEIGMGNFQEFFKKRGTSSYSKVTSQITIVSSVSNWGAYGIIAAIEKIFKINCMPKFSEVDSYLEYIVSKGAIDGITHASQKSVDSKNWALEKQILDSLSSL